MDQSVERWKQAGRIAVWMNPHTKDESWNLTTDAAGCPSLIELVDLMALASCPARRTLRVTKPNFTPDHGGRWKIRVAQSFRLAHDRESFVPDHFVLSEYEPNRLVLELGVDSLSMLRKALVDIDQRGGDYSIGNKTKGSDRLWVWWTANDYWDSPKPE